MNANTEISFISLVHGSWKWQSDLKIEIQKNIIKFLKICLEFNETSILLKSLQKT